MTQIESIRHGVHLEHVGTNKWRMTGKTRSVDIFREDREMPAERRRYLHTRRKTEPVWVVKETNATDGTAFNIVSSAISHAYEMAGALPLEL